MHGSAARREVLRWLTLDGNIRASVSEQVSGVCNVQSNKAENYSMDSRGQQFGCCSALDERDGPSINLLQVSIAAGGCLRTIISASAPSVFFSS